MSTPSLSLRRFGSWAFLAALAIALGTACGSASEDSEGSGGASTGGSALGSGGKGSGGSSTGTGGSAASGGQNSGGAPGAGGLGGGFPFGGEFSGIGGFSFGAGGWMNGDSCPTTQPKTGDGCTSPVLLSEFLCTYGTTFCLCNPQESSWQCVGL